MKLPDIYGYPLGIAVEKLSNAGISNYNVKVTSPPRIKNDSYDDSYRVVRCRKDEDGTIEVLICKPL